MPRRAEIGSAHGRPACMIDLQPLLSGPLLTLRPLQLADFEVLYAAASDPLIWEQHPEPNRWQRDVFRKFFDSGMESGGAFAVIERASGDLIGSSRYYTRYEQWEVPEREIAIGYSFLTRTYWGGATNGELKKLMLDHAFRWFDTVWFHIGADNRRSRKALEKIGGQLSHYDQREHAGIKHSVACYTMKRPGA